MTTLHVAWIKTSAPAGANPGGIIEQVVSAEAVTTSTGASAKSGYKPAAATHALVTSIDSNHYVVAAASAQAVAVVTTGAVARTLGSLTLAVPEGGVVAGLAF